MYQPRRQLKTSYMCFLYGKMQLVEKKSEDNREGVVGATPLGECYQKLPMKCVFGKNSV